jgi:hypothetical protein
MMLFNNIYGVDLGSSTVRIYSGLKNQIFSGRNLVAARGHSIIAYDDEAYDKEPALAASGDLDDYEDNEVYDKEPSSWNAPEF